MATLYKDNYFTEIHDTKLARIAELKAEGWSETAPWDKPAAPVKEEKPAAEPAAKPAAKKAEPKA